MNFILELLKISISGIIVFVSVYFLMKKYLDSRIHLKSLELSKIKTGEVLPLKLQAYERLMLFTERINIQALIQRLNASNMTVGGLQNAMLIAVQTEFEHNMAQQIYISENLWEIISLIKMDIQNQISVAGKDIDQNNPSGDFIKALLQHQISLVYNPIEKARLAIKQEVGLILQ